MSDLIFTWGCDLDSNQETQNFAILTNQFGDGYEQNIAVGVNNKKGKWSYQRTAKKAEIDEISKFLDARKGADSFLWSNYDGVQVRVKADTSYSKSKVGGDIWKISTTFTQVFYP